MYKNFTLQKCATIVIAVIILDWHIKLRNKFWKVIYNVCLQNSHIYVRSKLSFLKLWLHISQEDVACGAMCCLYVYYICAANLHYINCAVLFTLYLLTSAIDIVTIAGHHELLQVCIGAGGGDQGVTPSLATHSTAHRVTGELHQLETVSFSLLSLL